MHRKEEALRDFAHAVELGPATASAYRRHAQRLEQMDQNEAALAYHTRALELEPFNAEDRNELAWRLVTGPEKTRNPEKALPLAQEAVELARNNYFYLDTLGVVYYRLGQWNKATETLRSALAAPTESKPASSTYFFLAMGNHCLGQAAQAEECYRQAVERYTNEPRHNLVPGSIFAEADATLGKSEKARLEKATRQTGIGPRDPSATPDMVDLTAHYSGSLSRPWSGVAGNGLDALPQGPQRFGGVEFDVRGMVQLAGQGYSGGRAIVLPEQVKGIAVKRKCQRLHFLHGTTGAQPDGTRIGSYVLRYANGEQRELCIVYGEDARNWEAKTTNAPVSRGVVAWTGTNKLARERGEWRQVYKSTYENPLPDAELESIDFVSALTPCAPFLMALTTEP